MGNSELPLASADDHAGAFERAGFVRLKRRGRGSHVMLKKPGVNWTVCLPSGHGDVKRGLLAKQIKGAGLTNEQYVDFFSQ